MKIRPRSLLRTLCFAVLIGSGWCETANALPPSGRHHTGVIEGINLKSQHFTFRPDDDPKIRSLAWVSRTRFVRGSNFVDVTALRTGDRVEVIQHTPFLDEPFVTKVVILQTRAATKR